MALSQLLLSHFRSHLRVFAEFDGRPVALFGANGAGKTNLIEAISLLSPGRGLRRAAPEDLIRKPQALGWKIAAVLNDHEIETQATPDTPRSLRIDGKSAPQTALGRVGAMLWLTPAMDRLWIESPEGRRRFLDRMVLSFAPDHAEATLAYDKAMRERNLLLREGRGSDSWYDALELRMAENGAQITRNRLALLEHLAAHQDPAGPFPAADLDLIDDTPPDTDALQQALSHGRTRDMMAGRSLTGPHRADLGGFWRLRGMPAAQCSTGEQKALLISLVLAHARALRAETGRTPILLLDEVAAHLDPDRRAALYDAICDLHVQAFMTGTEPALFADLGPRAQHFHLTETQDGTRLDPQI